MSEKKIGVVVNKYGDTIIIKEKGIDIGPSYEGTGNFGTHTEVSFVPGTDGRKHIASDISAAVKTKESAPTLTIKTMGFHLPQPNEGEEEDLDMSIPSNHEHHDNEAYETDRAIEAETKAEAKARKAAKKADAEARAAENRAAGSKGPKCRKRYGSMKTLREEDRANYED